MNILKKLKVKIQFSPFLRRFWGYVHGPYSDYIKNTQRFGTPLGSHIESKWTYPDHFAHDNYQRGHLPQLCIIASGWKARLLSLLVWTKDVNEPYGLQSVWFKNGDHPLDQSWRPFEDTGKFPDEPREGKVVRYFRHPGVDGTSICKTCGYKFHDHGWIDSGAEGQKVCPGSLIYSYKEKYISIFDENLDQSWRVL